MGMNMDGMMMGQNIPEEDNIPVEDKAAGWNSAGAHLRKIIGGVWLHLIRGRAAIAAWPLVLILKKEKYLLSSQISILNIEGTLRLFIYLW